MPKITPRINRFGLDLKILSTWISLMISSLEKYCYEQYGSTKTFLKHQLKNKHIDSATYHGKRVVHPVDSNSGDVSCDSTVSTPISE